MKRLQMFLTLFTDKNLPYNRLTVTEIHIELQRLKIKSVEQRRICDCKNKLNGTLIKNEK